MITKNKKTTMNMLRKLSIVPVTLVAMYLFSCNSEGTTVISEPLSKSAWQNSWTPQNDMEEAVTVIGYGSTNENIVVLNKDVVVSHDSERKIARGVIAYHEIEQKPVFHVAAPRTRTSARIRS